MNKIEAEVTEVLSKESLTIVKFNSGGGVLSMMSLEVGDLKPKDRVVLGVKPTNIAIAKDFSGEVSYSNHFMGEVANIDSGELLSSVDIFVSGMVLESVITKSSTQRLGLKSGDWVTLFIKASDISILEVKK